MTIKIGPSGFGAVKDAEEILKEFKGLGFGNCEVDFTYQVYMNKEQAEKIGKLAKEKNIHLSIHASYFVNLNSEEKQKIHATMQRILKCCEIGHYLGAKSIVFHPGYYGKSKDKEEAFQNIKKRILEMMETVKENKWEVKLCPETMGKINVFGSPEEISRLAKETGCSFCIDFAHILAREKKVNYEKIKKLFPQKEWHCHFSGIEYGEKGERNHIGLKKEQWKELFENLPKDKDITIVCESPDRIEDCVEGLKILENKS